jgi:small conductance mechanosensitive channel
METIQQMTETLNLALDKIQSGTATFLAALPGIILGLVVFYAFYLISGFTQRQFKRGLNRFRRLQRLSTLIGRIVRALVIAGGFMVALTLALPSFQPAELIQVLGIGGVAVGFAFRDIFENFFAGILIIFTQPFGIGDEIKFEDYEGEVADIQIRATYLKTFDGRLVVIPNSELFKNSVTVDTAYDRRRNEYDVGISYADDIARAQEIMMEVMQRTPGVLATPAPDTIMQEMGDSAIVIRVRWWTKPNRAEFLRVQSRVLRDMKTTLEAEGMNIPFPIRTVMFYDQAKDGIEGETVNQERVNALYNGSRSP